MEQKVLKISNGQANITYASALLGMWLNLSRAEITSLEIPPPRNYLSLVGDGKEYGLVSVFKSQG